MRNITIAVLGAVILFGMCGVVANGKQAGQAAGGARQPQMFNMTTDKTMFWSSDEIQKDWESDETRKVANTRIMNGPADQTFNVRIVLDGDSPLVHPDTADLWIVQAGTATAVSDGKMVMAPGAPTGQADTRGKDITNPTIRQVKAGDLLYVPPGVPHYFKDIKGFRAFLIRFDPPKDYKGPGPAQ